MTNDNETMVVIKASSYDTIISLYKEVSKSINYEETENTRYDCRDIRVASNIADNIFAYYESTGHDKCSVGMMWVCYGPKADDTLPDDTVIFGEHFIYEEK